MPRTALGTRLLAAVGVLISSGEGKLVGISLSAGAHTIRLTNAMAMAEP